MNYNTKNEETYLTPLNIIRSLGEFDLDPACPEDMTWKTAKKHYTKKEDGLLQPWTGRVWCNPPYGRSLHHWLNKIALHRNGLILTFNRSDTKAFHNYVYPFAESIFLFKGRIKFLNPKGEPYWSAPAPSVLISYNEENADAIEESGLMGFHNILNPSPMIFDLIEQTWKVVVGEMIVEVNGANLSYLYTRVLEKAPSKVRKNKHYKAKIRQTLQLHYHKINNQWHAKAKGET